MRNSMNFGRHYQLHLFITKVTYFRRGHISHTNVFLNTISKFAYHFTDPRMFCTITPASYDLERLFHRENVFLKALVNFPYIKKNSAKSLPGTCQHYPLYSSFSPFSPYSYCTFPPLVYTTNASPCIGYKHRPEGREVATQRVVTDLH